MLKANVKNSDLPVLLSFCTTVETEVSKLIKASSLSYEFLQMKADKHELDQLTKQIQIRLLKLTHASAKKKFTLSLTPTQSMLFIKYEPFYRKKINNESAQYSRFKLQEITSEFIEQLNSL